MSDTRFGEQESQLDWENLSGPVPMDLIDPEFPAHPPVNVPAAASQALPREESEALAREAGAGPSDGSDDAPASYGPGSDETVLAPPHASFVDPRATIAGGTLFGGTDALQDDFARIRAEMEAEAAAEKLRKQEAEKEEDAQRARLEQWMANARARLLKADADLTGPAGRIRLRKDSSPSLYRLAEMQKTMHIDGDATRPDGTAMIMRQAPPDPMATISVPAAQFYGTEAPTTAPERLAQVSPPAFAETPAPAPSSIPAPAPAAPVARSLAFPSRTEDPPYDSGPIPLVSGDGGNFRSMSREEALTRKVAKLRMAAETGENTLVLAPSPEEDGEGRALNFAIAAVVLIAVLVLGLGLFAATQAGLFDGLENRIPFLKPKMANLAPTPRHASPAGPGTSAPGPTAAPTRKSAVAPSAAPGPVASRPTPAQIATPPRNNPVTPRPARAVPAKTRKPAVNAAAAAAAGAEDDDIPAYARPPAKAGNLGEIVLRNSIEAALNIDKDNLLDLYNRYALGFPGLSGEVVIGLTVDPSGRILEGSIVSSTTGVEGFDQELLRKVLDWRLRSFPEARPKFISVPFLFPMQGH
ncbi:MAG: hypothetical protein JF616_11530 [Fibrobacteres bacterium]|nr:hypothetical protein [Fibrobacterota bacterium]